MRWQIPLLLLFVCLVKCFAEESQKAQKEEYYLPYVGAPEYVITVLSVTNQLYREQYEDLYETIRHFAVDHHMRACATNMPVVYSGPPWCDFKDEHVVVAVTGNVRIAPYDPSFPAEDFKKFADSFVDTLRRRFPDRVKVEVKKYLARRNLK